MNENFFDLFSSKEKNITPSSKGRKNVLIASERISIMKAFFFAGNIRRARQQQLSFV
jgi:hypothetical protein